MEITVTEAANIRNVGRGAIFAAIRKGILKAHMDKRGYWMIDVNDLDAYERHMYNRKERSRYNGEHMFGDGIGYSIKDVAIAMKIPFQRAHYLLRIGEIKAEKKGGQWVVSPKTFNELTEKKDVTSVLVIAN